MSKKLRPEAGFTFVESLCTLSVLGLVLSLIMPNISALIVRSTYTELRYEIIAQLKEAQQIAMAKEMEIGVRFSNDAITTIEDGKVKQKILLPKDMHVVSNYKHNEVIFQETGQVRGGTIVIKQGSKDRIKVVIQVASGTIRMELDV